MKRTFVIVASAFGLGVAGLGSAAVVSPVAAQSTARIQTATFAIAKMTCATCPITVKKAMQGVAGVRSVSVNFETKKATVVFDPSKTNPAAIAAASTDAGYPAKLAG